MDWKKNMKALKRKKNRLELSQTRHFKKNRVFNLVKEIKAVIKWLLSTENERDPGNFLSFSAHPTDF